MTASLTTVSDRNAVSISLHLIGGALLAALPFALNGEYTSKSNDFVALPTMCIGATFIVGTLMIVKGLATTCQILKERSDRARDEACSF